VASGSSGHHMNVSFWINLALACVSPPIVKSHTDPKQTHTPFRNCETASVHFSGNPALRSPTK
jgi:hypothetical protein